MHPKATLGFVPCRLPLLTVKTHEQITRLEEVLSGFEEDERIASFQLITVLLELPQDEV